jgi:hypothetical protein
MYGVDSNLYLTLIRMGRKLGRVCLLLSEVANEEINTFIVYLSKQNLDALKVKSK